MYIQFCKRPTRKAPLSRRTQVRDMQHRQRTRISQLPHSRHHVLDAVSITELELELQRLVSIGEEIGPLVHPLLGHVVNVAHEAV